MRRALDRINSSPSPDQHRVLAQLRPSQNSVQKPRFTSVVSDDEDDDEEPSHGDQKRRKLGKGYQANELGGGDKDEDEDDDEGADENKYDDYDDGDDDDGDDDDDDDDDGDDGNDDDDNGDDEKKENYLRRSTRVPIKRKLNNVGGFGDNDELEKLITRIQDELADAMTEEFDTSTTSLARFSEYLDGVGNGWYRNRGAIIQLAVLFQDEDAELKLEEWTEPYADKYEEARLVEASNGKYKRPIYHPQGKKAEGKYQACADMVTDLLDSQEELEKFSDLAYSWSKLERWTLKLNQSKTTGINRAGIHEQLIKLVIKLNKVWNFSWDFSL
jgi:hypothetical protein